MKQAKKINPLTIWKEVGYEPHPFQKKIHASKARYRVVSAGRRTGKSIIGGMELVLEYFRTYFQQEELKRQMKRREFWIVAPTYVAAEKEFRVVWEALTKLEVQFDRGSYNNVNTGNMKISACDGRFVVQAKSADREDQLVGEGLSGVIMAEAALIRPKVWDLLIRPTLSDFKGWALFTSTPRGRANYFYDLWSYGQQEEHADWESWQAPSWSNSVIYPEGKDSPEIASLRAEMSPETFAQEIAASFVNFTGRVFKDFTEENHVANLGFNAEWNTYIGADWGYSNPTAVLLVQVSPDDLFVNVVDMFYDTNLTVPEVAERVKARRWPLYRVRGFYGDPASPSDNRQFCDALRIPLKRRTGSDIKVRLDLIRNALMTSSFAESRPKLMVDMRCKDLIREMTDYRYPEEGRTGQNENPLKKDDHSPEALGRFMLGYFGDPSIKRTARISHGKVVTGIFD